MTLGWNQTTFEMFASLHRGYDLPKSQRTTGEVPVVGANGVVGYHGMAKFQSPGVMIGRSGSVGKSYYINGPHWPLNTSLYVEDFQGNSPRFVEFFCQHFDFTKYAAGVSVPTLNRNLVHKAVVSIPPLPEQKKIAAVLLKIQQAIEMQDKIIQSLRDLKKSTMQHLFTYGLRGEKTKMTEIGEIPESWEIIQMAALGDIITGTTPPTKRREYYDGGGYQFIAPADLGNSIRIRNSEKEIAEEGLTVSRVLPKATVCFVCIGSSIGKVGITITEQSATNQQINAIVASTHFDPFFIAYLLLHRSAYVSGHASPSPVPIMSKGKFSEIPIPITMDKNVQEKIGSSLLGIENKLDTHESRKATLQDLFKTTLNKLMTADIRITDMEIDIEEVEL